VRSVRGLLASGVVAHVVLLVRPDVDGAAGRLLSGRRVTVHAGPRDAVAGVIERVRAHADQRAVTRGGDGRSGGSRPGGLPPVLLHDGARPLTPPALARAVVRAVGAGHAVAVPVLPVSDTVKDVDPGRLVVGSPDRTALRVVQTPQAFRPDLLGPEALCRILAQPGPVEHAWAAAGTTPVTVPGHPLAFAVRSAWDRELAEVLVGEGT
jgi:2-C-methyl-D-erythritol 4-phosphate cytidylyltransferase